MKLFHRTTTASARSILKDGFKDTGDPTGTNLGFYNQIPEIKAVWFSDVPSGGSEGKLLLLEIPDGVVQQLNIAVRMGLWGRSSLPHFSRYRSHILDGGLPDEGFEIIKDSKPYTEYLIPAEMANPYGPPMDITDNEEEYLPNRGLF